MICEPRFSDPNNAPPSKEIQVQPKSVPLVTGQFHFHGYLGRRVDTVAAGRLTDPAVRDQIYPET